MKVDRIETIHVLPRWLFLKVHTDVGIVGLGEATLEGRSLTVETAVKEIERYLVGKNPLEIEKHWQTIYRGTFYRNGPVLSSALSGVEQALWDILGKHLNVPVYQLLGGKVRDKIRMYGWVSGEKTGSYVEDFKASVADGKFTAYKTCPVPACQAIESPAVMKQVVDNVRALREAAKSHVDIGVDFHGRCTPALSKRLCKKLEQFDLMFVEEPVLPGDVDAMKDISRSTSIPIAAGERLFTRWQFQELIEKQAVAIIQPDVSHCGGIMEVTLLHVTFPLHPCLILASSLPPSFLPSFLLLSPSFLFSSFSFLLPPLSLLSFRTPLPFSLPFLSLTSLSPLFLSPSLPLLSLLLSPPSLFYRSPPSLFFLFSLLFLLFFLIPPFPLSL
ncbi:D-galactonate dehydratase-like isoform X1 [Corticium candelabrum]|uniref:D-galactonate dehydratase-like isoform X1 n=1 Tax=Corticium candelabrum TaxID=121492 RepID=UPI002E2659A4|nr:D-galactonate dehydratase-like isoform X1 [Corticium candelabrum]XP_062510340.1 D-galactonate dehydratase-like isoform X1 [Corticium candelabrum]